MRWGRPWKVINAKGNNSVVNRYYGNGSLKEVEDAKGNVTKYEYNGFMGLAKTTYEDDTYEQPTYDSYRRVTQTRGRSGQTITLTYDDLNRVKTKTVRDPNFVLVNTITYQYDLLGRLYKVTDNTGTTKNTYDKAGRLIRVEYPGGKTVSYLYDASSNRTRLTYPDSTYMYDNVGVRRISAKGANPNAS
jgi:YD repeat-containing protein